jgi:hypothetical protein
MPAKEWNGLLISFSQREGAASVVEQKPNGSLAKLKKKKKQQLSGSLRSGSAQGEPGQPAGPPGPRAEPLGQPTPRYSVRTPRGGARGRSDAQHAAGKLDKHRRKIGA